MEKIVKSFPQSSKKRIAKKIAWFLLVGALLWGLFMLDPQRMLLKSFSVNLFLVISYIGTGGLTVVCMYYDEKMSMPMSISFLVCIIIISLYNATIFILSYPFIKVTAPQQFPLCTGFMLCILTGFMSPLLIIDSSIASLLKK